MKKLLFLIIIILLSNSELNHLKAQAPNWEWKTIVDGGFEVLNINALNNGNTLTLGRISRYRMTISEREYNFTAGGIILINQSSNGAIQFLKPYYNIYHHFLNNGLISDENGNCYLSVFTLEDNVTVDNTPFPEIGDYVIKTNSNGEIIWATKVNGTLRDIKLDKAGDIVGVGVHTAYYDLSYNIGKMQIIKLSKQDGSLLWEYKNEENIATHGVFTATDTLGNTFVLVNRQQEFSYNGTTIPYNSERNVLLKVDATGDLQWYKSIGSNLNTSNYIRATSMCTDNKGGLFFLNYTKDNLSVNNEAKSGIIPHVFNLYFLHWDKNGDELTYKILGTTGNNNSVYDYFDRMIYNNDQLYFTTKISDTLTWNNRVITVKSEGQYTARTGQVIACMDTLGSLNWAKTVYTDMGSGSGKCLDFDIYNDEIIVSNYGDRKCSFDDGSLYTSDTSMIAYIAKLSHTTSVPDINDPTLSKNQLFVYPNPTHNNIHLQWNTSTTYDRVIIRDILGREVWHEKINTKQHSLSLSLGHLPKGIYNIEVSNATQKQRTKIVLQ